MLWASVASLLFASGADSHPSVDLYVDHCVASRTTSSDDLKKEIEFRLGYGVEINGAPRPWTTKVELRCVPYSQSADAIELWVHDPISRTRLTRTFALDETKVADEVTESLRATWSQVPRPARRSRRTEAGAGIPAAVTRRVRRASRRPPAPWEFDDGPAVLGFVGGPLMFGEVTRVVHRPLRHLAWSADGVLSFRGQPVTGGRIRTLAISLAPSLLAWAALGPVDLYGGAGVRGGFVRMRGLPESPPKGEPAPRLTEGIDSGYWLGPTVVGRLAGHPSKRIGVAAHVEAGWTVIPVRELGRGTFDVALDGAWVLGTVELVTSF